MQEVRSLRLSEREMEARRETIIQNAFEMFCDRGIEAVTLLEITTASGVGENTIYRYFGSKENLVLEAFIKLWDSIMTTVEEAVEATPNYDQLSGYQQIRAWINGFRRLYETSKDFILFSYEAKLYLLRHKVRLDQFQQDMLMHSIREPCLAALNKGKADGSIPVQRDSEDLFYAIWGSVRGYVVKIVIYNELYGEDSPWEKRYQTMADAIMCALHSGFRLPEEDLPPGQ